MPYCRLSAADVAARLGVSRKTVYLMIKQRRLPPRFKLPGKPLFFYEFSIAAWERENGFESATTSPAQPAEVITLDDLAARWNTTSAVIHDLSALRLFPRQVDVSLYDLRRVEFVEEAHGGKGKLLEWVKMYEKFIEDNRSDDNDFSATVRG